MDKAALGKLVGAIVGLTILIPLVLLVFIAPASKGEPRDLPIGVAGPAQAVAAVEAGLAERKPGAFEITTYRDGEALAQAARDRDVYGGFVVGPNPQTVIASGASPAVASTLTAVGTQIASQGAPGVPPVVVDVAAPADGDPRGSGFGSMVMPVFMAGVAIGLAATFLGGRRRITIAALVVGAFSVSAAAIGVATAIGVLDGDYLREWLALGAGILAIAGVVAGLVRLVGTAAIGLVALAFMLVGMPLAGIAAPPEFLPAFWAGVGQSLPLGATGSALRSAAFFDGAGSGRALITLAVWIVVGLVLLALPKKAKAPAPVAAPAD